MLVLLTQYFDTLREIGTRNATRTLFLASNRGAANNLIGRYWQGYEAGEIDTVVSLSRAGSRMKA